MTTFVLLVFGFLFQGLLIYGIITDNEKVFKMWFFGSIFFALVMVTLLKFCYLDPMPYSDSDNSSPYDDPFPDQ